MMLDTKLGKPVTYDADYDPQILDAIPRARSRDRLGIQNPLPFRGRDLWTHYEVSWLNEKGKPQVALAEMAYGAESKCLIESKSMKLYFNTFNQRKFQDLNQVLATIQNDLQLHLEVSVDVHLSELHDLGNQTLPSKLPGLCLDALDVDCSHYQIHPAYLLTHDTPVTETVYSHLFKSNCLITKQPDWATVVIAYQGPKIDHEGLLKYLISFRKHDELHEACIERIFMDLIHLCKPMSLSISGRFTRRGGLDINVYRETLNLNSALSHQRLIRQ